MSVQANKQQTNEEEEKKIPRTTNLRFTQGTKLLNKYNGKYKRI